jgi:hypothetical protein
MRPDPHAGPALPRAIVGFHRDQDGVWVAELECGHTQHLRHDPPWQSRPWLLTREGRDSFVGQALPCVACGRGD